MIKNFKPTNMKIYISGKITGIEAEARVNFAVAENIVKTLGHAPVNPFKIKHKKDALWADFMKKDIRTLVQCDAIWMLPDWQASKGARLELQIAYKLGLKLFFQSEIKESHIPGNHMFTVNTSEAIAGRKMMIKQTSHVNLYA